MSIIGNPIVTTNYISDSFSGDASTVAFTLSQAPASATSIAVYISGLYQIPSSAYTISGTTLTFTGAPPTGTNNITVLHLGVKSATLVPVAGSVTPQMLSNANVVYWSASNNNVGIGNTTPTSLLTVTGTATLGNTTIIGKATTSGIVGINGGTPGTDYALNLNSSTGVNGGLLAWNDTTTISTAIYTNSTGNIIVRESAALLLGTNNTERMRIAANGYVGIGTSTPSTSLDLSQKTDSIALPVGTTAQRPTGSNGHIRFNSNTTNFELYRNTKWLGVQAQDYSQADILGDGTCVAYYPLNGGYGDLTNNYTGTGYSSGSASYSSTYKKYGQSFYCYGPNIITLPTVVNAYPFTVMAWVSSDIWTGGTSGQNRVIMNTSINGQRVTLGLVDWSSNGTYEFTVMYGGTNHWTFGPVQSSVTNGFGNWYHVAFCIQASNDSTHAVYLNGTALTAQNRGSSHGGVAGWRLGGNTDGSEYWRGYIDQARVFNRKLSATEVQTIYNLEA